MSRVAVIDSGVANLASISDAISSLGCEVATTGRPEEVDRADYVVLPGVGHFEAGLRELRRRGLDRAVLRATEAGRPLLAICLGLQMLCDGSAESPGTPGLGVVPGSCRALPESVRLPHLGWNGVAAAEGCRVLTSGAAAFANSFALLAAPAGWNVAWSRHGKRFVAALERGRTVACQFHPELSGTFGLDLLQRWLQGRPAPASSGGETTRQLARRIVPCLDVRHGRVVKGIRFQNLRDAGDPAERAALYEQQGADEIVLLDIAASPEGQSTHLETVRRVRRSLRIPLTVGGGVRSVEDARRLLSSGADKVAVNTAAVRDPDLLGKMAANFGRQCVVLAIDARRRSGDWQVLVTGGREATGLDAVDWARRGAAGGAGEILLTSWDRDGTRSGCDLELVRQVSGAVSVPVIASGGIGSRQHVAEAMAAGADAVLAASIFHDEDQSVTEVKSFLAAQGFAVRQ